MCVSRDNTLAETKADLLLMAVSNLRSALWYRYCGNRDWNKVVDENIKRVGSLIDEIEEAHNKDKN